MNSRIFVNLPVKDLDRSMQFFTRLGFSFDPQFTSDKAACMVVSEGGIYVMLLVEAFFKTFTPKPVCDATQSTEVIVCLSRDSREAVDEMVRDALLAGATTPRPAMDQGFMYQHGFQDLDGHLWELVFMQPAVVTIGPEDV